MPSFAATLSYDTGARPQAVAVGDFNEDGFQDLAVVSGGTVNVLLSNGDNTFQPPRPSAAGNFPRAVAVGDFNGDGILDLAAANSAGVSVLLGNGDGSFQAPRTFAAGPYANSLAVADFNSDGLADLAVANTSSGGGGGTASVLLGNGDGTFQDPRPSVAGFSPSSVVAADWNGDGLPDVAVANPNSNTVSVLLGMGDGSFQAPLTFAAGFGPNALVVEDFNGDGIPDLAVANNSHLNGEHPPFYGTLSVLLGNADGTLQERRTFAAGGGPDAVAVGDFNGDGVQDIVVANGDNADVSVFVGSGDGTFLAAPRYAVGAGPQSVAVGDFNGDGIPDLITANAGTNPYYTDGGVSVLLGNGDGSFQPARDFAAGSVPFSVAVGDFNGDGIQDLAVADVGTYPLYADGGVSVLLGNGDGSFQPPVHYAAGSRPVSVALGD